MRIGIDFSINHIGICIEKNNEYSFTIFIGEKCTKKYDIICKAPINSIFYERNQIDKSSYSNEQQTKLEDAINIAKMVCDYLENVIDEECEIHLEGFSYNSKSNNNLDLVLYGSILRFFISSGCFGHLKIISPTEAKKTLSGKGNANKQQMVEAFMNINIENNFVEYLKNTDIDFCKLRHIDDLVDSFAILKTK